MVCCGSSRVLFITVASEQGPEPDRYPGRIEKQLPKSKVGPAGSMLVLGDTMRQEYLQFSQVKFT